MLLARIPVRISATDPAEYAALADVLGGGQTGALSLCADGEAPLVAIVCPSAPEGAAEALPALYLGRPEREDGMPVPAALADVLTALEGLAARAADSQAPRMRGGWRLDPQKLALTSPEGRDIALTDTETRLLLVLFDAEGTDIEKDILLQRVWGYRPGLDTHTLETHIYRLRQKIETNPTSPVFLMTSETGYRLS